MNRLRILVLFSFLTAAVACDRPHDTENVLEDENQRREMMSGIARDHHLMDEMHGEMMKTEYGRSMFAQGHMDSIQMMNRIMANPELMQRMIREMHSKNLVDDNCMKLMLDRSAMMHGEDGMMN